MLVAVSLNALKRSANRQRARFEIHVRPCQRASLTTPEADSQGNAIEGFEALPLDVVEQHACLLHGQWTDFSLLSPRGCGEPRYVPGDQIQLFRIDQHLARDGARVLACPRT